MTVSTKGAPNMMSANWLNAGAVIESIVQQKVIKMKIMVNLVLDLSPKGSRCLGQYPAESQLRLHRIPHSSTN